MKDGNKTSEWIAGKFAAAATVLIPAVFKVLGWDTDLALQIVGLVDALVAVYIGSRTALKYGDSKVKATEIAANAGKS